MRLCPDSGLELVDNPASGNFRIARTSFGALAPVEREPQPGGSLDIDG